MFFYTYRDVFQHGDKLYFFRTDEGADYSQVGEYDIGTGIKKDRVRVRLSDVVQQGACGSGKRNYYSGE